MRCRHKLETHTSYDPVAAGMHVESYDQCIKCGEIFEPCGSGDAMYRNEDEFVRGQKIKLVLIGVLALLVWAANGFHFHGMFK